MKSARKKERGKWGKSKAERKEKEIGREKQRGKRKWGKRNRKKEGERGGEKEKVAS